MMHLSNDSVSSLGSNKDKQLPPTPRPDIGNSNEDNIKVNKGTPGDEILEVKSLRRKNFKKLSLAGEFGYVEETLPQFESLSLTEKRKNIRPAPALSVAGITPRISLEPANPTSATIATTILTTPTSTVKPSIHLSNRNVDPNLQSSNDIIISELSNMASNQLQRKRQTVISSISPTKSTALSPLELHPQQISLESLGDSLSPISTTSSFRLNNSDLVTLKVLGLGNSGTVSKILHIPTQKTMAKKIIHIDLKTVIKTQIIRELRILHECQSPFIIEFYGAFVNNNNTIVICMEYCNCGSLDKILPLCSPRRFPIYVLKKLAFAILSGLTYLYTAHRIIHRDIKPSNVLMTHKGEFKLCDFGVSRELTNSLAMADTFVGTSTYMSPERIQGLNYGVKSDVWSMGLMLIELASGSPVWSDETNDTPTSFMGGGPEGILDLLQRIVNETPPSLSDKQPPSASEPYDSELCTFIDSCLIKNDSVRKSPWDLLLSKLGFLIGVDKGVYDKDVKNWAKKIRKLHKEKSESEKDN